MKRRVYARRIGDKEFIYDELNKYSDKESKRKLREKIDEILEGTEDEGCESSRDAFTTELLRILENLASSYNTDIEVIEEDEDENENNYENEVILASVKVRKRAYGALISYCANENLSEEEVLSLAIEEYIRHN